MFTGLSLCFFENTNNKINFIEQLLLIFFIYLLVGFLISLPFYLSNLNMNFLNAYFESISGLTGTGFSVFENIKYIDPTLILWRSSSQWIGGLFFLVFIIIFFSNKFFDYKMTQLTYSGENKFISKENIKNNILKLFIFYSILSFIFFIFLSFSGIRLFNALNLSMTLISGGGFLPTESLGNIITNNFQKIVFTLVLTLSMLNFYLIFNLFNKKVLLNECQLY